MEIATGELQQAVGRFNERWRERLARCRRFAPPPWWGPGLVLTAAIRGQYEQYLPVRQYLRELAGMLAVALPEPAWVPAAVRCPEVPSLPDLWATLPPHLAGRVTWEAEELYPLACALAAPTRHGTAAGRYPEQEAVVRAIAGTVARPVLLDVACGTGQGTWELAGWLPAGARAVGISPEPLEIEMARTRRLPHWEAVGIPPALRYPAAPDVALEFAVGRLGETALPAATIVVCNGLVGGPLLHRERELGAAWAAFAAAVAPGGAVLAANRFHAGHTAAQQRFAALAPGNFRQVAAGVWRRDQ